MAWEWLAPTVTGIVGVAGIAGTVTVASTGRRTQLEVANAQMEAEQRRMLHTDKRDLYARVLHQITDVGNLAADVWRSAKTIKNQQSKLDGLDKHDPDYERLKENLTRSISSRRTLFEEYKNNYGTLMKLQAELMVVAGSEFGRQMRSVINEIEEMERTGPSESAGRVVDRICDALHQDLTGQSSKS